MDKLLGNYTSLAETLADSCEYPFSYLHDEWKDPLVWQNIAGGRVFELLSYRPPACPLNPRRISAAEHEGLSVELVAWDQPLGPPTQAYFLKPLGIKGKLPAVLALHCHGGFKYYGKEKITAFPGEPEILKQSKARGYGGVSWASELAKRGYAVLAPDVFLWGSRRLEEPEVPANLAGIMEGKKDGTDDYIEAYNQLANEYESLVAKSLFMAGTTWPGVMLYDGMRAVDYLFTRDDVDRDRIGCGGLSGGGEQAIFLSALDRRIRCAVVSCFMTTFSETVKHNIHSHTWMFHLPHLANLMDLPDLASLSGGRPLMVQNGNEDPLFSSRGREESSRKLDRIYEKLGCPEKYSGRFYPGGHKFDLPMQEDAFCWYDRWLK
jgi:dienelactone hydrolase